MNHITLTTLLSLSILNLLGNLTDTTEDFVLTMIKIQGLIF